MHAGQRLVLKYPGHTSLLDGLLEVFPDACFVHLLRRPDEIASSCSSLIHSTIARLFFHPSDLDPIRSGLFVVRMLKLMCDRFQATVERRQSQNPEGKLRMVNVRYEDFLSNPVNEISHTYRKLGFSGTISEEFETAIRSYLQENPQNKHGKHHYSLEEYGLTQNAIQALIDYCRTYGVDMTEE